MRKKFSKLYKNKKRSQRRNRSQDQEIQNSNISREEELLTDANEIFETLTGIPANMNMIELYRKFFGKLPSYRINPLGWSSKREAEYTLYRTIHSNYLRSLYVSDGILFNEIYCRYLPELYLLFRGRDYVIEGKKGQNFSLFNFFLLLKGADYLLLKKKIPDKYVKEKYTETCAFIINNILYILINTTSEQHQVLNNYCKTFIGGEINEKIESLWERVKSDIKKKSYRKILKSITGFLLFIFFLTGYYIFSRNSLVIPEERKKAIDLSDVPIIKYWYKIAIPDPSLTYKIIWSIIIFLAISLTARLFVSNINWIKDIWRLLKYRKIKYSSEEKLVYSKGEVKSFWQNAINYIMDTTYRSSYVWRNNYNILHYPSGFLAKRDIRSSIESLLLFYPSDELVCGSTYTRLEEIYNNGSYRDISDVRLNRGG